MLFGANRKQGESSRFGMNLRNVSCFGYNQPGKWQNWYSRRRVVGAEKSWQRDGDWLCSNSGCRNVNFAFRKSCNWCGVARPARTITVQMTADELKKWCQFKCIRKGDKEFCESTVVSAGYYRNIPTSAEFSCNATPWLVDSGASRHMVGSYENFSNYAPNVRGQGVKLADGSTQAIMGTGTVMCGPNMPLSSVLHVPSFPINLLSISCITEELNCAAIFYPKWCLFQEIGTRRELGRGSMHDGLYYLNSDISPVVAAALSYSPLQEFMLLHRRLGHMSFSTLGKLYPHFFNKIDKEKLVCDACEYGKLIRSS